MPKYIITISTAIEAKNEKEAEEAFWDIIDNVDYPIKPVVVKQIE